MAQTSWLFLDDFGGRHRVGLYHGDQSGHLVIYADKRVVQIDFHVKETKTYTFFIEDELIEIHIWKEKDGKFTYEFVVNKEANTPRNQERKIVDRRNSLKIALIFGGGLLFMLAIFFGLKFWNDRQRQERWDKSQKPLRSGLFLPPGNLTFEKIGFCKIPFSGYFQA